MSNYSNARLDPNNSGVRSSSATATIRAILPVVGLVIIFFIFQFITGRMISSFSLLLSQVYVTMIASMGVFFIMSMGGLDFSQGSILGMASIVICIVSKINIPLAVVCGILTGAAIGAINGFFYVNRKIRSFIVTICTMFLFRGIIKYLTSSSPISGSAYLINLDTVAFKLICTVVVMLAGFIAFRYLKFGTYLKAIGAGEKAASFAGIRTDRMKFWVYVLSGAITGFAALINVVKVGSATYNSGSQLETQILIALVLGGMPISGGAKVRFLNIIVGSFLFIVLKNGLTMMGFDTQTMQLIEGVIFLIFVAVFADRQSLNVIK